MSSSKQDIEFLRNNRGPAAFRSHPRLFLSTAARSVLCSRILLFTFCNIRFYQAVQCTFHLYHNVHQPVVLFAKPLVFFFQSIFAMSLHAHCFRPPYASSAAALSCVHFLLLKYIIHFPVIEKWFLNASFDTVRRTHDMHGQSSAPQDSCCPQTADLVQQRNQYKKECALAHSRASRGRLRQSTSSRECASLAR